MRGKALQVLQAGTVIPAIPLALNAERHFDEAVQRRLIRYYLTAGAGGIAAAVHTTQFEIREPRYHLLERVLRVAADEVDLFEKRTGKTIVRIAGACGPEAQAVSEAGLSAALGYDAVLLSPGGLNDSDEETLLRRTRAVARVMPVIGFYLQSAVGGRRLSFDYWKALCGIPGVVAVKAAAFDRYQTLDLVRGCAFSSRAEEVALYTGNDDHIVFDLLTPYRFRVHGKTVEKRFVGGLLGHWSVWTRTAVRTFDAIRASIPNAAVPDEMLSLAAAVTDCNGAFFDAANGFRGCIAGVHAVLCRQGLMRGTWCLNPDEKLSPGQKGEIDRVYDAYPSLNDDAFVRDFLAQDASSRREAYATPESPGTSATWTI